jgi:hypothetical protein
LETRNLSGFSANYFLPTLVPTIPAKSPTVKTDVLASRGGQRSMKTCVFANPGHQRSLKTCVFANPGHKRLMKTRIFANSGVGGN